MLQAPYRVTGFIWHGHEHYVAYLLSGGRWHCLDDAVVSEVDVAALPSQACMVFLQKTVRLSQKVAGAGPRAAGRVPHPIWMQLPEVLAQAAMLPASRLGSFAKRVARKRAIRNGEQRSSSRQQQRSGRQQQRSGRQQKQRSGRQQKQSSGRQQKQRSGRPQKQRSGRPQKQRSGRPQKQRSGRPQQRSGRPRQRSGRQQKQRSGRQQKQSLAERIVVKRGIGRRTLFRRLPGPATWMLLGAMWQMKWTIPSSVSCMPVGYRGVGRRSRSGSGRSRHFNLPSSRVFCAIALHFVLGKSCWTTSTKCTEDCRVTRMPSCIWSHCARMLSWARKFFGCGQSLMLFVVLSRVWRFCTREVALQME